jgi:general secretion pathway protein N
MTAKRLALYGLVVLTTVLINLPAALVGQWIEHSTKHRIQMLSSQGTVWKGQLSLSVNTPSQAFAIPDPLQWQIRLMPEGGWLGLDIAQAQLSQAVLVRWNNNRLTVNKSGFHAPAAWLNAFGAPYNTIRPEGVLHFDWESWEAGQGVDMTLIWQDAQSALSSIRPLGEYKIAITGVPSQALNIQLTSRKGPLLLEGLGTIAPNQRLVFNGYASAQASEQEALKGLLSQLGKREGTRYRLTMF